MVSNENADLLRPSVFARIVSKAVFPVMDIIRSAPNSCVAAMACSNLSTKVGIFAEKPFVSFPWYVRMLVIRVSSFVKAWKSPTFGIVTFASGNFSPHLSPGSLYSWSSSKPTMDMGCATNSGSNAKLIVSGLNDTWYQTNFLFIKFLSNGPRNRVFPLS